MVKTPQNDDISPETNQASPTQASPTQASPIQASPAQTSAKWRLPRSVTGVAIAGFVIAGALYGIMRLNAVLSLGANDQAVSSQSTSPATRLMPVRIESVSEFTELGETRLQVSGTAEPDSVILILNRGERVRQIKADEFGTWQVSLENDGGPAVLETRLFGPQGGVQIRGDETVFRIPAPQTPSAQDADDVGLVAPTPTPALLMLVAPGRPSRIFQSPFGAPPRNGPLAMGPIDYDDSGGVIFSGTTTVPGRVRIYAGGAAIGETRVGVDGQWNFIAGNLLPLGEYPVRVELIPTEGERVDVSVPFERLPPIKSEAAADDEGALSVAFDAYHWQVRRTLIGGGSQSTVIFAEADAAPLIIEDDTP